MSREFEKKKPEMLLEEEDWDSLLEEDDEFDAAVKEEYMKEAEEIEHSLLSEEISPDMSVSEEETQASYERLVELMKKKGIYCEDAPADSRSTGSFAGDGLAFASGAAGTAGIQLAVQPASDRGHNRRTMHRQFKMVRAAGIAVACLLGVFLASMTSEANREYVVQAVKYFMGNGAYVTVNSDSENEGAQHVESEIREEIETTIGVKVPEIKYRPDTFELYDYAIFEETSTARMEYMYNGTVITFDIYNYGSNLVSRNFGLHGDEQTSFYIEEGNIQVWLTEIVDESEALPSYTAEWEKENVLYQFSGRMEKEIFEDIIKNMKYY